MRNQAATVLGGLHPQRILATGESQSASRLVTYIDAIHPLVHVYDGFMVHSRSAGGSRAESEPAPGRVASRRRRSIRDDLDVPVMVVEAEGDVINSNLGARQPDTAMFREWEMAGTSHADSYTTSVGFGDIGDGRGATQMLAFMQHPQPLGCDVVRSTRAAHHWILQAAFRGLETWVRTGVAPPAATPLAVDVDLSRGARARCAGQCPRRRSLTPGRCAHRHDRRGQHAARASASSSAARRRSHRPSSRPSTRRTRTS